MSKIKQCLAMSISHMWQNANGRAAQRLAHQPPQAHRKNCQNANDLAREAVGCMGVLACGLMHGLWLRYASSQGAIELCGIEHFWESCHLCIS
jgi:hypothetical protein